MIPDEGEAMALHRKFGSSERVIRHCSTVAAVSRLLALEYHRVGREVDTDAILSAARLHDIGRTRVQTARHGLVGCEMLMEEGVDQKVVEIVRKHVGAGISPDEARSLGFPNMDYVPRTPEERIVCFADKMVDSATVRPFEEEVRRFRMKGHDVDRLLGLRRGIQEDIGTDPETVVLGKIKEPH